MKEFKGICESFNWLTPEFSILPTDRNVVKIKGVAMPKGTVSKNNKKYVDEEMTMAARTWIDAPVTPNHAKWSEKRNQKGKVNWMEYDAEDGMMEYVAEVWDPELVTELRVYKENPSASKVRGVSIEADYLHIRCIKCGAKFFSEEEWKVHCEREHYMKDLPLEPHGIRGRALSIVLAPETPGVQGNTLEVMETAQHGLSQLLDIIVTNNKLKEEYNNKMSRIALSNEQPRIVVSRSKKSSSIKEEDEAPTEEPQACPEGQHRDPETGECVPDTVSEQEEQEPCPEGQHRDPETGECVADKVAEYETPAAEAPVDLADHKCPNGEHWDEQRMQCVLDIEVTEQEEQMCPEGEHWDAEQGKCVKDEEEAPQSVPVVTEKLKPFKLSENAPKLKLGEPFAGYADFEDCVAKNSEKDNPEAYCGQIKHEAEGEMYRQKQTEAKLNEVIDVLNNLKVTLPKPDKGWRRMKPYNDKPLREAINRIKPYNDKPLREALAKIKPYDDAELKRKIDAWKPYDDSQIKAAIEEAKYDDSPLKAEITSLKETLEKKDEDLATLKRAVEIADENVSVKDKIAETTHKTVEEISKRAEKLEEETKTLKEQLEKETTRADNAEDKLKGQFKGAAQTIEETKPNPDLSYTPDKNVGEKKK